jgi:hypothetical protein
MEPLYKQDLAYIQAAAFGRLAQGAAPEIIRLLKCAPGQIRRVVDVGCGAGPLSAIFQTSSEPLDFQSRVVQVRNANLVKVSALVA